MQTSSTGSTDGSRSPEALALEKYQELRPVYDAYAGKIKEILLDGIPVDCPVHSIEFRAKAPESFKKKACKRGKDGVTAKYASPLTEITDLAGIRVIVFFPKSLAQVHRAIESDFEITEMKDLGEERIAQGKFGYKSIHYLVKLRPDRTKLPEYRKFKGLTAEVQVRTILQHAWAEMEHDIQYKSTEQIPSSIQRRFIALAGMLEIADREFQAIQDEDSSIRASVKVSLEDDITRSALSKGVPHSESATGPTSPLLSTAEERGPSATKVRTLLTVGKYSEAVVLYSRMIDLQPSSHTLYLGRAKARFLAGDRTGALEDLSRAKSLKPGDSQSDSIRSQIEEGRAISSTTVPQEAWQYTNRGNEALAAGNGEEAFDHYSRAQELGLNKYFALLNKAMACTLVNDLEGAKYFLSQINLIEGSPTQINVFALRMAIGLLEDSQIEELSRDLSQRLSQVAVFDVQQSPLRHLEKGIMEKSGACYSRVRPVFDQLRLSGIKAGS